MANDAERDLTRIKARQEQEITNVFGRVSAIYATSRKQAQRLLQGVGGISIVEWRTLWDLSEAGPMTISDLAKTQRADHSLLSRALPEMRRKGLVTVHRAETDGRQTIVTLTEQGRDAYRMAAPVMAARRAAVREAFTDAEFAQLIGFLDRLEEFVNRPVEDIAPTEPAE